MNKFIAVFAGLVACIALGLTPAQAKGPGWKTNGGTPPGFSSRGAAHRSWASVPPGWSHGKKTGWGNDRTRPPGWR
jgi:hypothetical protein